MPQTTIHSGNREHVLDARADRIDHRDRPYRPPLVSLPPCWPTRQNLQVGLPRHAGMVDRQGEFKGCTGFGLAAVINFVLWRDALSRAPRAEAGRLAVDPVAVDAPRVSPFQLYHLARVYDEWEGEDYEGSSCRGAVKGFHKHGACRRELWPGPDAPVGDARWQWQADAATRPLGAYYRVDARSINDLQAAVHEVGAVYVSAQVHGGWASLEETSGANARLPVIRRSLATPHVGLHAFAIIGYEPRGWVVQNSWGSDWGYHGYAILPYRDFVDSAVDAWVAVLGAPTMVAADDRPAAAALCSFRCDSLSAAVTREPSWLWTQPTIPSRDATKPLSTEEAYALTIVMENDGRALRRRVGFDSVEQAVDEITVDLPLRWFHANRETTGDTLRFAVYVHGGLNSEEDSIRRVRIMAPYFLANGVYPLFVTWRTSFYDSILGIMDDSLRRFFRPPSRAESIGWADAIANQVTEATDRAIEVACQNLLVKPVWTQIKQNAQAGIRNGRGLYLLSRGIEDLIEQVDDSGGEVQLHLIGHSAGALPIGHLLRRFRTRHLTAASCRLFAPACTADFANDHFVDAMERGLLPPEQFYLHAMSDELERADRVGPYGKSLLYLISRALETHHKEPILGMAAMHAADAPPDLWHVPRRRRNTSRRNPDVQSWQERTGDLWPQQNLQISGKNSVTTYRGPDSLVVQVPNAHGEFDNDVDLVNASIGHILGGDVPHPVMDLRDA